MTDSKPLIGEADPEFERLLAEEEAIQMLGERHQDSDLLMPISDLYLQLRTLKSENEELRKRLTYVQPVMPFNSDMWLIYEDKHGRQRKQHWGDVGPLVDPYTGDELDVIGWWTEDN